MSTGKTFLKYLIILIRISIYLLMAYFIFVSITWKQNIIANKRKADVISPINIWQTKGKPVSVLKITKTDFHCFFKLTAEKIKGDLFESYLPQDEIKKLQIEQEVYSKANTDVLCGKIINISKSRDLDKGLFKITLNLKESNKKLNSREVLFIKTETIENSIQVPQTAIDMINNQIFVDLVKNSKKQTIKVTASKADNEKILISEGLKSGDQIIVDGGTLVQDGEKVLILKELVL